MLPASVRAVIRRIAKHAMRNRRGPNRRRVYLRTLPSHPGRVPVPVEKRNGAFFRLVQLTTNAPPARAATGGTHHEQAYQEARAVVLLFSLVVSGQIKLRKIDGWRKIAAVLSRHTEVAA